MITSMMEAEKIVDSQLQRENEIYLILTNIVTGN